MDFGALVIRENAPAIHGQLVKALRAYFDDKGLPLEGASVTYSVHPLLPGLIVAEISASELPDPYLFHSEHPEIGAVVAQALGCEVWRMAHERRCGSTEVTAFDAHGGVVFDWAEASGAPLRVAAKRLGVDGEVLRASVEQGTGPRARLVGDIDAELLTQVVAAAAADERSQFPDREQRTVFLPEDMATELQQVAARLEVDVGSVLWAAWEWSKPESYKQLQNAAGRPRRATKSNPPSQLVPGDDGPDEPAGAGERVEMKAWLPRTVTKQLDDLAEYTDRSLNWVLATAYRHSRAKVRGAKSRTR